MKKLSKEGEMSTKEIEMNRRRCECQIINLIIIQSIRIGREGENDEISTDRRRKRSCDTYSDFTKH
jgi:hypothetical protein